MLIAVCVKQSLYPALPFALDEAGRPHQLTSAPIRFTNPVDRCALEAAMEIRAALGCEVIAISSGTAGSLAVQYALAYGVDRAIHVVDDGREDGDPARTAEALSVALSALGCDLVLGGTKSVDSGSAQVMVSVAELLDLPHVTGVVKLEVGAAARLLTAERKLEHGWHEVVRCTLPVVVCVEPTINQPRYVSFRALKAAAHRPVEVMAVENAAGHYGDGLASRYAYPRPRTKKLFRPDSNLTPEERLRLIMSGGVPKKDSSILEGSVNELASTLVKVLRQEGLV